MLYAMGERWEKNRALCPKTCAVLDEVPDLFQAFFRICRRSRISNCRAADVAYAVSAYFRTVTTSSLSPPEFGSRCYCIEIL